MCNFCLGYEPPCVLGNFAYVHEKSISRAPQCFWQFCSKSKYRAPQCFGQFCLRYEPPSVLGNVAYVRSLESPSVLGNSAYVHEKQLPKTLRGSTVRLLNNCPKHWGVRQFDFCDVFMNVSEITQNTEGLDSSTFKYLQTENRPFSPMVRKFL